jgi:hypothetical protein
MSLLWRTSIICSMRARCDGAHRHLSLIN